MISICCCEKEIMKLNIIVAYRDPGDGYRKRQLDIFLEQMDLIFKDRTDYHVYVIEQESDRDNYDKLSDELKQKDSKMAKFNLGRLIHLEPTSMLSSDVTNCLVHDYKLIYFKIII